MAFRQVKDLLGWVHDFHAQLGARYVRLAETVPDERLQARDLARLEIY